MIPDQVLVDVQRSFLDLVAEHEATKARLAEAQRRISELEGIASAYDAITRAITEAVGPGDPSGPYWEDGVRFITSERDALRAQLSETQAALDRRLRERAELTDQLAEAQRVLRLALASHDDARRTVKQFVDAERGGDYLVADAAWATEARSILATERA